MNCWWHVSNYDNSSDLDIVDFQLCNLDIGTGDVTRDHMETYTSLTRDKGFSLLIYTENRHLPTIHITYF